MVSDVSCEELELRTGVWTGHFDVGRLNRLLLRVADISPFITELNRSPALDDIVSSFAGEPVVAHSMPSNYSHVNIGEVNAGLPVDRW